MSLLGTAVSLFAIGCQAPPVTAPTAAPPKPTTAPAAASPKPAASPAVAASPVASPVASPAASPAASPVASPAALASPSPAAVASPAAAAGRIVTIEASDFAFNAPDTIQAGLVTLRMRNVGQEPHHAQLMRLNTNVTIEQFMTALSQGPGPAMQLVSLTGGPAAVDANGTAEVIVDLPEGQYVLVCFIESPDGLPHLAKGMVRPMRVTAPPIAGTPPTAAQTVTMKDFSFEAPATLPTGRTIVRTVNEGPQPHEMAVVRLAQGRTLNDVTQWFPATPGTAPAGPPPFQSVGGMQGLDRSGAGFAVLDLQAGDYAMICMIPDPGSGRTHLSLGMGRAFSVR